MKTRPLALASLSLTLLAASPTGKDAQPPSTPAAPLHVVLIFSDRPADRTVAADLPVELPSELEAAWIWSPNLPPRRVERDRLREELAGLAGDAVIRRSEPLRVGVEATAPRTDLEVVAGPLAMFEEVPEGWLPTFRVSPAGTVSLPRRPGDAWRVRLLGQGRGGGWLDVAPGQRQILLSASPAVDLRLSIAGADARQQQRGHLTILEDAHGRARPALLAKQLADRDGLIEVRSLPLDLPLTFVAGAPGFPSRVLRGRPADLPPSLRLPPSSAIAGRLVDPDGVPLEGGEVRVEGWLDDEVPVLFTRTAESDEEGRWAVEALPPRSLVLVARREGSAPVRERLSPAPGVTVELGDLVLSPGHDLAVAVHDTHGVPVAGAAVRPSGRPGVVAGEEGVAVLRDLAASPVELTVEAGRFLPATVAVPFPWPERVTIELVPAFLVAGRFVGDDLLPVGGARIKVVQGQSFRYEELAGDGGFALELLPDVPYTLHLSSPITRERTVEVTPGAPGEERDLGNLTPPPGVTAFGTVVSALDGSPVAGVRVWTPRPSADPLGSWLHGDLLATRTDALGRFELGGLDARPDLLRIEASGYARLHVGVQPAVDETIVDVGVLELHRGATLRVSAEVEDERGLARVDLRQEWQDVDMLTAAVVDGVAELPHVGPGEALVSVLAGGELVCERTVRVPADTDRVDVDCGASRREVTGRVVAGDRTAGPGVLVWSSTAAEPVKATIFDRVSHLGMPQQQVFGAGRPPVRVEVTPDGTFRSRRLPAGRWNVAWYPTGGEPSPPQTIELPSGERAHAVVRLSGGVLSGFVHDGEGQPVGGAWVRELTSGAIARSDGDGAFRLTGMSPGECRLQAREGTRFSEVTSSWIEVDRLADPVDLVLSDDHEGRRRVQVWTPEGLPAAGALVFLDAGSRGVHVVSADASGQAELTLAAPYPDRVRLGAYHGGSWTFGGASDWSRLRDAELEVGGRGEIVVTCEESAGAVTIVGPQGWDVSALFAMLGTRPSVSPDRPLLLSGLPQGAYSVLAEGGPARSAVISSGRPRAVIELD